MSNFKVYQDYCLDATLVSNVFIDNYMGDANDAQIKIYLYLLRVICAHKNCSISDLADQFNYTEKDVTRALKYWEKKGLLSLEYDPSKNLVGVRLLDLTMQDEDPRTASHRDERSADNTVTLAPIVQLPVRSESLSSTVTGTESAAKTPASVKSSYTADDISNFRKSEGFDEFIFVIEQYLGKTLTPSDIRTLMYIQDELGFSADLIYYLFEYSASRGKKDLRYIEKVALGWFEEGIKTPKEAKASVHKYDREVYDIMKLLGKSGSPTRTEIDFIERWRGEYGYGTDIIAEACRRTVMATDNHRFSYADSILSSWHASGVHKKSDIDSLDEGFAKKKAAAARSNMPQYKKFAHNDSSSNSDLEKELLSN